MKNKWPLIIIALVLLVGIGGFLVMSGRKTTSPASQVQAPTQAPEQTQAPVANQPKSLKDLLALNRPQTCTFSDNSKNSGNIFVASSKMRGDFTSEAEGKEIKSHIIVNGQTSYFWMEGQTTGYKISVEKLTQSPSASPAGNKQVQPQNQVDINKQNDYSCKDWTVNPSVFNIPTDIKFSDFSSLIPTGKAGASPAAGNQNINTSKCAACDNLSGDVKTQCKTALKCN